jgi:hypothetical protein
MADNPLGIKTPDEVGVSKFARWALYGDNGVGKTYFVRSIPPELRVLVFTTPSEPILPLHGLPNVKVKLITEWPQISEMFDNIRRLNEKAMARNGKNWVDVVVWDTWTRMQEIAMNKVLGQTLFDPYKDTTGMFAKILDTPPKYFGEWKERDKTAALANQAIRMWNSLDLHMIFLLQEELKRPKVEHDAPYHIHPLVVTPAAMQCVKETCSIVGRLYVDLDGAGADALEDTPGYKINPTAKEIHRMLVGKHAYYTSKGPTDQLGYVVTDPTWRKLAVSLTAR